MHDTAIKNFCIAARRDLMAEVALRAARFGIREDGYEPPAADVIDGRPLSVEERRQRAELIRRLGPADGPSYREAYENLVDEAAYTWFNRLVAIRFMELNDRLPSHVRMLSAEDGAFAPQVLREALDVAIEGADAATVARLVSESEDEALFRYLFLAQCRELSSCLPDVFEPVGAAMELLLPEGLLRQGGVVQRLVDDIPEADWTDGVEIVGWMYQYYVSERKDEVFASFKKGKKADAAALAPATQLFTPDWIVQYLAQNSLGRLWMQAHPESTLPTQMSYYIPDDLGIEGDDAASDVAAGAGERGPSSSPESIKVIDPACGSGHILVYAFRLLAAMYEEAGYGRRDIPRLILQNNLTGCEIDPRAAQIASFALAMTACEWDSRFLRRDEKVRARIVCLRPAELTEDELEEMPYLAKRTALLDAMAHMGECGSLFVPEPEDRAALQQADDELDAREAGGDLLAHHPRTMVTRMLANCEPLAETYDAVIANPPYMGGKNMNKWLSDWVKKNYPDVKGDLFSCFIQRNLDFACEGGQLGFMTPYVWMFIGTYEKLRNKIIEESTITSLVQLEYSGFAGATVPICTFTLQKGFVPRYRGGYVRLSDFVGAAKQAPKTLEAIANPSCGWFYRRSSDSFKSIPGTPIAYWASLGSLQAFQHGTRLSYAYTNVVKGIFTGDNERFLRFWHEVGREAIGSSWKLYTKGGAFRRWCGNIEHVVEWGDTDSSLRNYSGAGLGSAQFFGSALICWTKISSGAPHFRFYRNGLFFDDASPAIVIPQEDFSRYLCTLGFLNSCVCKYYLDFLAPTLNYQCGDIKKLPVLDSMGGDAVQQIVTECMEISESDWNACEFSFGFRRNAMVRV